MVSGVADVDGEGEVGIDGVGGRRRAAAADFFLGRGHGDNFGGELFPILVFREPNQSFTNDIGADFIVEGAGGADAAVDEIQLVIIGGDVADGNSREGFFF